jgi:hypothetical protein
MNTLEQWMGTVCADLEIPADAVDVAHGVARPAAPLTAYLAGVAVGRGLPLQEAAGRVQALAATWPASEAADMNP